ncbi:MAG: 4-aminobutyrate aminotransferase [Myxococcales bacterium]
MSATDATPFEPLLPALVTEVPGPGSRTLAARLQRVESRNVTWVAPDGSFPVFWERAAGSNVWDVDGNRYLDLTAAFGVASCGHGHPRVVEALIAQARKLLHGMGDVHPSAVKVELCERLAALAPGDLGHAILGCNGADAVEAALKTALLHTGRPAVIAFAGGYHGLTGGALSVTSFERFRRPFEGLLAERTTFLPYPDPMHPVTGVEPERIGDHVLSLVRARLDDRRAPVGAIIVEPVQGRGGEVVPPAGFLRGLRELCDGRETVLIADEIYTGLGRTGALWACDHEGVVPDLLCVGKALSNGMPLSACLGRPSVMEAWPPSQGEAIHTSTFLGHPGACAAALAALDVIGEGLPQRAAALGGRLCERLRGRLGERVRGRGLLVGVELTGGGAPDARGAAEVMMGALRRGVLVLPSGTSGNVVAFSPPLTIDEGQLLWGADVVADCILALP